ncbi:MAG TPA: hypothetical protein VF681_02520 [Abditibacteriaceae bacterium]|jgi:hypothetical protein
MQSRSNRSIALFTGGVIAASLFASAAPARAAESNKTYKTGAIVLGAAAAIFAAKGKQLPAVVAGAGAYYAYKKSQEANNRYGNNDGNAYPGEDYAYGGDYQQNDQPYYDDSNDQPYYGDYGNANDAPPYYGNDGAYADNGGFPDYGYGFRAAPRIGKNAKPALRTK